MMALIICAGLAVASDAGATGDVVLDRALSKADAVFVGTVTDVRMTTIEDAPYRRLAATFRVQRRYKGAREKTIVVHSDGDAAMFRFEIGRQYLVFAELRRGVLDTHRYRRTARVALVGHELKYFEARRVDATDVASPRKPLP